MTVDLGMQITVFDERASTECNYRIVAPHKADPAAGLLSSESPVARALAGHVTGETVSVTTPRGPRHLRILALV
ncbi:MAG: GreA/GreB family elongation factor [Solirubrobacteraceae bacterium]